jgi:hypothetical protein
MGEIAEMMLDGTLDCETGEFIDGRSPGYPRTVSDAAWDDDFTCPVLSKKRPSAPRLKTPCPVCGKGFRGYGGVKQHMADKHAAEAADMQARQHLIDAAPDMLAALKRAEQFIVNGVSLGFIRMPDPETPDSAHDTLPAIRAAIAKAGAQ